MTRTGHRASSGDEGSPPDPWRILWHVAPGILRQPWRLGTALVALLAGVLLRIAEPWPLQYVIDTAIAPHRAEVERTGLEWMNSNSWKLPEIAPTVLLALSAVALVLIATVRAAFDYYRTISFSWIGNQVVSDLRAKVYRHVQSLSMRFHQKSRGGDLTVRLIGDINTLKDVAISAALPLLSSGLLLLGMFAVMLLMNWRLGLMVIAVLPIFWLLTVRSSRKIHASAKKQRSREGALAAAAAESMMAVKSVQAFGAEAKFSAIFQLENARSHHEGVKTSRLTAGLERSVDVLIAIASALVLWQGGMFVIEGTLSPGELVVYLAYLKRGFKPLQDFAKYTGRLSKAMAAGQRITELLEKEPLVRDLPNAKKAPTFRGAITLENLSFHYDERKKVFENFDLKIGAGERLAIVGPSGVGKSTMLSLLLRLYDPTQGRVLIDGEDIRKWTIASLREQLSIVLQENSIFAATVRENIALGAPGATFEEIRHAAGLAMADDFIQCLPMGYETVLGERGSDLSQGQRQRIAIARARLRNSPILLLDEPTSCLDSENRNRVMNAICHVTENRTTLVVTHDVDLAMQMDRVLCMNGDGSLEIGTPSQLKVSRGGFAELIRKGTMEFTQGKPSDALPC